MRDNGTILAIAALAAVAVLGKAPGGVEEAPARTESPAPKAPDPAGALEGACTSAAVLGPIEDLYPGFRREVLIATVPDPIDSQAGWLFDAQLEAIVGAIERKVPVEGADGDAYTGQKNYTRDRYVLPWNCRAKDRDAGAADPRERPGLVVFRNRNQKSLLLLFLVGETPTFGIHERALFRALDAATEGCGPKTHWIRLMAPTFTGSAMSLRAAIERWWEGSDACPAARFKIISGSASDFRNKDIIELPLRTPGPGKPWPRVSFQATVVPEEAVLNAVYRHLEARGATLGRDVALLAEAGTSYGKSAYASGAGPLVLTFPMRMGRLRGAGGAEPTQKGSPALSSVQSLLGLDDIGTPGDLFPTFFPKMHNPSDELVLGHLLATISKEHYRYVGLLATDPRDKLYLAKLIQRYCPDVGLFTVQSDLLFAHPEYNRYLKGMIVGSTYPLFNVNQWWSPPWKGLTQRLQFPRNMAQGAYNATLALLERRELLDYGAPFGPRSGQATQPPIWLGVVGHERLWPLEVAIGYHRFLRREHLEADARNPYTYVNTPPEPEPVADEGDRLAAPRHFLFLGGLLTLGILLHFGVWLRHYLKWRVTGVSAWEWLCFWAPVAVLFLLGLLWWRAYPELPPLGAVVAGETGVNRVLFTLRTANLQGGVSLLTPFLLLALAAYLLGFAQLKRLLLLRERDTEPALHESLAERFGSSLDHARAGSRGWGEVGTLERAIEDAAYRAPWNVDWRWTAVVLGIALGSLIGGLMWVIPVIDSAPLNHLLVVGESALLLGVLLSFVQFAVLWRELQRLLAHFSLHPMVRAFERLPRRLIGQFHWHPLPVMPRAGPLLGQYFEVLAQHIDALDSAPVSAKVAQDAAEAGLEAARSTHGRLALAMPPIAELVRTERWMRPALAAAPGAASPAPVSADPRGVWLDRAEELIAIHVAQTINYVFLHLWNLLTCATLALLLLLFAAGSYPLQPQGLLNAFLFAIAVTVIGWTLRILVQINRNDLLSRIQKTEPDKTTFDRQLVSQVLLYGVVPILSLLTAQFPAMAWAFSWIEGVLKLVK